MMGAEAYMAKAAKECSHAAAVQAEKGDPVLCLGCAVKAAEEFARQAKKGELVITPREQEDPDREERRLRAGGESTEQGEHPIEWDLR